MKLLTKCAPAALVLIAGILHAHAASAALMGQYLFEEGSGTIANDSSGFARNGTLTGATGTPAYAPGLYTGSNNSLQFNYDSGTSTYTNALIHRVALPTNTGFVQNAPAMTMMAWVRPDVIANQGGTNPQIGSTRSIVGVSETTGGTRGILQLISGTGQVRVLGRRVDGGGNANFTTNASALTPGQTYFLVGIMDYVNADIRVYVNGVLQTGTAAGFANLGVAGPTNLSVNMTNAMAQIGTNTLGAGEQWNGLIDGVRIFDHALTAQEILATYVAEIPEPTSLTSACLALFGLASVRRRRSNA